MTEEQALREAADKHAAKSEAESQTKNQKSVARRRKLEAMREAKAGGFDVEELLSH